MAVGDKNPLIKDLKFHLQFLTYVHTVFENYWNLAVLFQIVSQNNLTIKIVQFSGVKKLRTAE